MRLIPSLIALSLAITGTSLAFASPAPEGGRLTAAASPQPSPTLRVIRGFRDEVYEVVPAPTPSPPPGAAPIPPRVVCGILTFAPTPPPTPDPRATLPPFDDGVMIGEVGTLTTECTAAAVALGSDGLHVEYALVRSAAQPAPTPSFNVSVPIDNIDDSPADDYVDVTVTAESPDELVFRISASATPNVYPRTRRVGDTGVGRLAPWISGGASALTATTPSPGPTPTPNSVNAAGVLIVPWSALHLPNGSHRVGVAVTRHCGGCTPKTFLVGRTVLDFSILPAFVGIRPINVVHVDADRRMAALTQSYQNVLSLSAAPPATVPGLLVVGTNPPVPLVFSLPTPSSAFTAPPTLHAPPLTADVDSPLGQRFGGALTLSQNNAVRAGVEKAITTALSAPQGLPSSSPFPAIPCETCGTLQSSHTQWFDPPVGSTRLSLLPKGVGSDDATLALKTLPDLAAGATLYYAKDSDSSLGFLYARQNNTSTPNPVVGFAQASLTDAAVSFVQQRGRSAASLLAAYTTHQQFPPLTVAGSPAPSTVAGNVTVPYLASYSATISDDHLWSSRDDSGGHLRELATFGRVSYDQTDHALSSFGGLQEQHTWLTRSSEQTQATLLLAYRSAARNYNQLDGSQVSYPTTSGPVLGADLSWHSNPLSTQSPLAVTGYDLNATWLSYRSSRYSAPAGGRVQNSVEAYDAKAALFLFGGRFGLTYEQQETSLNAPLAAVTQLSSTLGDWPYQSAVNQLAPGEFGTMLHARDRSAGISLTSMKGDFPSGATVNITVADDFDHVAPVCAGPPVSSPYITCTLPVVPMSVLTYNGSIKTNMFTLAGSYKPSYFQQARTSSPSERVYNLALSVNIDNCDAIVVTSTNDTTILNPLTATRLQNAFQAELDLKRSLWANPRLPAPTIFAGVQNLFGFANTSYSALLPVGVPLPGKTLTEPIPLPTHTYTVYAGLRLGNRPFYGKLLSDPTCKALPLTAGSGGT